MSPEIGFSSLGIVPGAQGLGAAFAVNLDGPIRREAHLGGRNIGLGAARFVGPALVATAVAATLSAGVAAIGATVRSAGALEQSMGAIDTVFRESAGQMHQWSASAATSVGLAKNDYNELSVLIGSQLKNAGTPMDELAGKTNNLVTAGADMASMFGGTTKEAVEAISSALKGERDPIERYGVSLNEAKIQAKMAEDAMNGVTYASEEQAKAAATLALIMEQTADANGNFARESQTYEGVMQRLGASWQNVTTTIGQGFLPIATAGGSVLLGMMPSIQGVADKFAALAPAIQGVTEILLYGNYDGGLFAAFSGLSEDSGFIDFLLSIREAIVDLIASADPAALAGLLGDASAGVAGSISSALATALPILSNVVPKALDWWVHVYAPAVLLFESALIGAVIEVLPKLTLAVWQAVPGILAAILGMLPAILTAALTLFTGIVDAVLTMHPVLLTAVLDLLPVLVATVVGMLPTIIDSALSLFLGIVTGLLTAIPHIIVAVLGMLPSFVTSIVSLIPLLLRSAVDLFKSIVAAIPEVLPHIVGALVQIGPPLVGAVSGLVGVLVQAGIDIVAGLVRGLLDSAGGVFDMLLSLAGDAVDAFKSFFGIHSPSRLLMDYGEAMGDQLAAGITALPLDAVAGVDVAPHVKPGGYIGAVLGSVDDEPAASDTVNIRDARAARATAVAIAERRAHERRQAA
jgi:phage-related protein